MAIITHSNVEALIDAQVSNEIIEGIVTTSQAMKVMRRLDNMTSDRTKIKVEDFLPIAQWVNESVNNGRKAVGNMGWKDVYLVPAELAVTILIKENDYYDTNIDLWGKVKPRVIEAFGKKIDEAVFLGIDRPVAWGVDIATAAKQAGNIVTPTSGESYYSMIDRAMAMVEADGFTVNRILGGVSLKSAFRNMLDNNGQPIVGTEIDELTRNAVLVNNGAWNSNTSRLIVGDFSQGVYAVREDISMKVLTEATIVDGDKTYNLAQDDMIGLRFKMRIGFAVPNPATAMNEDGETRYPFAVVAGDTGITTQTVTFTVTDKDEATVSGATVSVAGLTKKTGSAGTAVVNLQAGNYLYKVAKQGLPTTYGEITVASTSVAETVVINTTI